MEGDASGGLVSRSRQGSAKKSTNKLLMKKSSNELLNRSENHSRASLRQLAPAEEKAKVPAEDPEYKYALAMAGMNFGVGLPAGQDNDAPKSLERQKSTSSLKKSTSSLSRSRAGSVKKIPQLDVISNDRNTSNGSRLVKSNITSHELHAMSSGSSISAGHQLDAVKGKSFAGPTNIIRSLPNHGQAVAEKLKDLSLLNQETERANVTLPAIDSAMKSSSLQKASGAVLLNSSTTSSNPVQAKPSTKINQVKLDPSLIKPTPPKGEPNRSPHLSNNRPHHMMNINLMSRSSSPTPPSANTAPNLMIDANKHSRKASEDATDGASDVGSNSDGRILTPHEIRERMLQYHATAPESVPEKRAASTVSNSSAVSSRGQKAGQQPQTHADGRPVWKPAGGMDPTKREEFFRNRMRAKEIAERTRQEILASGRYDSEDDDENSSSVEASEESIRDALGPFSRPGNGGPPPLDQEGNELPTANTFAHTILKVMDKYDTPLPAKAAGDAATNLAQGMTLSSRPSTSQKKIISYPVPTKKKKVTLVDVPPTPEPQPNEPEIVEQVDAPLPPEPKPAIPELTPKEKLHRKAFSFVSKLDEERMAPRPQQDPCTPHEIRMIFVNDFSILDSYITNQRNNEMAMLVRDVDVVPTGILQPLEPEQVTEMSWNLYRYLRSMSESFVHQEVAKGLVEIMEEDEEDEHKMFEIKRLIARLPEKEFIKVKAVIGHIERLANINRSVGVTLHASLSNVFAPVMLRRPCRKIASNAEVKTPFDRAFRAGSAYTVHSRHSVSSTQQSVAPPLGAPTEIDDVGSVNSVTMAGGARPNTADGADKNNRSSVASNAYGSLKKKREHGASMGHMVVAGVTLKDPALDPAKWEALTVASDYTEDEQYFDSAENVVPVSEYGSPPAPEPEIDQDITGKSIDDLESDAGEDSPMYNQEQITPTSAMTDSGSSNGRPSSAATTARGRKKKGLRPVPGFRQDFPERDAVTPLMPPSISPQELLAIITNQAEREETQEESSEMGDEIRESEFGQISLNASPRRVKESLTIVTAKPLTRLSTMTEVESVLSNISNISMGMLESKISTAVRTSPSYALLEDGDGNDASSPGDAIDFGDDDPDGFGWNLVTRKGIAQALFLDETVNTAQAAALELMLKYYANVFSWNTFQQQSGGRNGGPRSKPPQQS